MNPNLNLYPSKISEQCSMAISNLQEQEDALAKLYNTLSEFVNDSYIKSVSFDNLKAQCNNYLTVISAISACNRYDIADFKILKSVVDEVPENLIGEKIDYWEKYYQALISKYNSLLESGVHSQLQAYFGTLLSTYQELYNMWYAKELLYYEVDGKTSSLFEKSNGRQAISNMLAGLKTSFTLNNGYDLNVISAQEINKSSYEKMYINLNSNQKYLVDRLGDLPDSFSEKKQTMKYVAIHLLYEGFKEEFVIGVLANIMNEGEIGQFENSSYTDLNKKPSYLHVMDNHFDYGRKFSNKNITEVGMKEVEKLFEQCKTFNNDCMNFDKYPLIDEKEINSKTKVREAKFGLGAVQYTQRERVSHLFECYTEVMTHSDCISLEDCALAETTMITRELSGYYADDDLSYIYTKWESSKDNNGIQGSRNAAKIFFNDFERAVDTRQVDERADIAEEIYRGIYPNE